MLARQCLAGPDAAWLRTTGIAAGPLGYPLRFAGDTSRHKCRGDKHLADGYAGARKAGWLQASQPTRSAVGHYSRSTGLRTPSAPRFKNVGVNHGLWSSDVGVLRRDEDRSPCRIFHVAAGEIWSAVSRPWPPGIEGGDADNSHRSPCELNRRPPEGGRSEPTGVGLRLKPPEECPP